MPVHQFIMDSAMPTPETEETKQAESGGDDHELREKAETLEKTLHEREKQLQVYAMQNARLMDLLTQAQRFVSSHPNAKSSKTHLRNLG